MSPGRAGLGGREAGLDAARALAVIGMMAAHTARLIPSDLRPGWARGVLLFEPIIPTLFLLMVGLSLARSLEAAILRGATTGAWYARQARRAAILWAISSLFYVLELGARFPDFVTASGILANIAYAILIAGGLLALSALPALPGLPPARWSPALAPAAALAAGTAIFVYLDARGARVFAVNAGNAPFLPLWLFALAGAAWGASGRAPVARAARVAVATLGAALAAWLILRHGAEALFTKPVGRSDAGRDLAAPLLGGGEALHVAYYNLRPVLAVTCLGIQLAALTLLGAVLRKVPEGAARVAFALGRRALDAYILHLALLAVLVVSFGKQPLDGVTGSAVLIGVIIVCQGWTFFRRQHI